MGLWVRAREAVPTRCLCAQAQVREAAAREAEAERPSVREREGSASELKPGPVLSETAEELG